MNDIEKIKFTNELTAALEELNVRLKDQRDKADLIIIMEKIAIILKENIIMEKEIKKLENFLKENDDWNLYQLLNKIEL